jgi:hypothetical protein
VSPYSGSQSMVTASLLQNLSQNSRCLNRDSNHALPVYESEALSPGRNVSVICYG